MPKTEVLFYCEEDGSAPLIEWFDSLPKKAIAKCRVKIDRLHEFGHELKRPDADYLKEDIYELRTRLGSVNYRMLYFFHGKKAVVLSHGFTKQQAKVPAREIKQAVRRKKAFKAAPQVHTYKAE